MIPIPLILGWLRNNYQVVILGLMLAFLGGYILYINTDRNHWKKVANELQLIINQAKAKQEELERGNAAITQKYATALAAMNVQTDQINKLLKEKIDADKELKSLRVSLRAIRLFNESKVDPTASTPSTVGGNASEAAGSEANSTGEGSGNGITIPLNVVWKQVADNDAAHWKCVHQVEQWQNFWKDYEQNYNGVVGE